MHHGRSAMEANASLLKRQVQPLKTNKIFFFFLQNLSNFTHKSIAYNITDYKFIGCNIRLTVVRQ
jgi:hypothetical protein